MKALPDDLYCLTGSPDVASRGKNHWVRTWTKKEVEEIGAFCGMRADWILLFEDVESDLLNLTLKPLVFGTGNRTLEPVICQVGKPRSLLFGHEQLQMENAALRAELAIYKGILE